MKTAAARPLPGDGDVGEAPDALTLPTSPLEGGRSGGGGRPPAPHVPTARLERVRGRRYGRSRTAEGIDEIMRIIVIVARRRPADG